MTTATATDTVAYHRRESRACLAQVDAELERGELAAASQALWDAAAHAIKAAAKRRGWPHDSFTDLGDAIDRLAKDDGCGCQMLGERRESSHLIGQYMLAAAYGKRPDGISPTAGNIRYGLERVGELIYSLENPQTPTLADLASSLNAGADPVRYHRSEAWRRLEQVDDEINLGLGEHARDSLWAAAIHAVKAAALRRNRPHETWEDLNDTVNDMISEEGLPSRAFQLYLIASSQSREGWQIPKSTAHVGYLKADIAEFVGMIEQWDEAGGNAG